MDIFELITLDGILDLELMMECVTAFRDVEMGQMSFSCMKDTNFGEP